MMAFWTQCASKSRCETNPSNNPERRAHLWLANCYFTHDSSAVVPPG